VIAEHESYSKSSMAYSNRRNAALTARYGPISTILVMTRNLFRTSPARIGLALAVLTAGLVIGATTQQLASADVGAGDRPIFVPMPPCRLVDTRSATALAAGATMTLTAHGTNGDCTLPNDALALSMNVTSIGATAVTFLTIWPDGTRPNASSLNPAPGQPPTPNAVNVSLSPAGTFNVYNNAGNVDLIVDINGYYAHHTHDDRYYTEPEVDAAIAAIPAGPAGPVGPQGPIGAQGDAGSVRLNGRLTTTIRRPVAPPLVGLFSMVKVDAAGIPLVASQNIDAKTIALYQCLDAACVTATPGIVAGTNGLDWMFGMALGSDGHPIFTFRDDVADRFEVVACEDEGCATTLPSVIDVAASTGTESAIAVRASGLPIIAYDALGSTELRVASCGNKGCQDAVTTTRTTIASGSGFRVPDITVNPSGHAVITYVDTGTGDLVVATCNNFNCTGATPTTSHVVDTGANVSNDPSIAIGLDGNPVISYRKHSTGDLNLVMCADALCASSTILTLDTGGADDVGWNSAVTMTPDGRPLVSYFNNTNKRVTLSICADSACSSNVTFEFDPDITAGAGSSITLSDDGSPIVTYHDFDADDVVIAYISGTSWTPNNWES
jgi:hypothetical protein